MVFTLANRCYQSNTNAKGCKLIDTDLEFLLIPIPASLLSSVTDWPSHPGCSTPNPGSPGQYEQLRTLFSFSVGVVAEDSTRPVVKRAGLTRSAGGETGIVTFIPRFGSALNLNFHFHMLVSDGVYTFTDNQARFHHAPTPSDSELEHLLETLIGRITRTLVRAGVLSKEPQSPWLDIHPDSGGDTALEQPAGAAVRYHIAVGPLAGRKTMTLHRPGAVSGQGEPAKTLSASRDGFSLNGAVVCQAHQRDKLERWCRYVSRGPIALGRLSIDGDGLGVNAQGSAGAAKHMDVRERPMNSNTRSATGPSP